MLLNERLTRIHSQKDTRLHFGEGFSLTVCEGPLQGFPCDYPGLCYQVQQIKNSNKETLLCDPALIAFWVSQRSPVSGRHFPALNGFASLIYWDG